ncbi:putative quinol monooxygenase [Luteibacter yeojuensis]|jgi:quinol monooxygenase YgiN
MTSRLKVIAVFTPKPGHETDLEQLLQGMAVASRKEPGNLHYDLWRQLDAPGHLVIDELYVNAAANEAHRASAHFRNYLSIIDGLADRTVLVLSDVPA